MAKFDNILKAIGKTPLIRINKLTQHVSSEIYAKIEALNPGGSIKSRIALNMIESAEKKGLIDKNTIIIEPTSGNTGIGLAMVCAVKGYELKIVMPDSVSIERQKILKAYGVEVILTPSRDGMKGSIAQAEILARNCSNSYIPNQFKNPANPEAHSKTTALEIWEDMDHNIDVFIAGIGTGGTITGVGTKLLALNPEIKIIGVEPSNSHILSGGTPNKHKIQGIGAGFIPKVLNTNIFQSIITVNEDEAFKMTKDLAFYEGIFVGISAGAVMAAALKYCEKNPDQEKIVIIFPDTGERYLSAEFWN
ncbi:cysteine synthase A [Promethearchaeum syntrophicum]|uniref:Cysteine synthase A n=1 Tax=Promethearchaeum syntrophicum TaxID=2594042 RepID=A0A5B9DC11_9ARCH